MPGETGQFRYRSVIDGFDTNFWLIDQLKICWGTSKCRVTWGEDGISILFNVVLCWQRSQLGDMLSVGCRMLYLFPANLGQYSWVCPHESSTYLTRFALIMTGVNTSNAG